MSDDPDTLAQRIARALESATSRRGDADDLDDYDAPRGGRVPYDRFAAKAREARDLRAELEAIRAQVADLQTGYASQLEAIQTTTAEEVKTMAQRHAEDLRLVEHGIKDDLGRAALRQAWEAQPRDGRGKSPADWWGQQVQALEAHRADPEAAPAVEVPRVLQGYLPPAPAPAPAPARGAPMVDRGAQAIQQTSVGQRLASTPVEGSLSELIANLRG
jgi:hypothetical protein